MEHDSRHQCLIYDGAPSRQLPLLATIMKAKMDEGYRCLYLNSPVMVAGMRSTLAAMGIDVTNEIARTRLVLNAEPISTGHDFNGNVMLRQLEDSLDQALNDGYKGLWATGDMTWEFGPINDFSKLLDYEWGLEDIFNNRQQLCGVCQYHRDTLPHQVMRNSLLAHPAIVINETLFRINPQYLKSQQDTLLSLTSSEQDAIIAALCELRNTGS